MAMKFQFAARTDVGLKREENEDTFLMVPEDGLFLVADGMGGHKAGRLASSLTVQLISTFLRDEASHPDFEWRFDPHPDWSHTANILMNAIRYANERVFIQSCKRSDAEGMGTTITAIYEARERLVLAHVGDSRIYRFRNGQLRQLTRDHSLLNHMIREGQLSRKGASNFQQKNVILRAIGLKDDVDVSIREELKQLGDVYVMCSDGLTDMIPDDAIVHVLNQIEDLEHACERLIELALEGGGKDNVTVACLRLEDVNASSFRSPQARPSSSASFARPRSSPFVARPPTSPRKARPRRAKLLHAVRQPQRTRPAAQAAATGSQTPRDVEAFRSPAAAAGPPRRARGGRGRSATPVTRGGGEVRRTKKAGTLPDVEVLDEHPAVATRTPFDMDVVDPD